MTGNRTNPATFRTRRLAAARRTVSLAPISFLLLPLCIQGAIPDAVSCQSLRGSSVSLDRQVRMARLHDFTFIESPAQVERFVKAGYLVPVRSNRDFDLHNVSYPYARSETRTFIQRLASQYRQACGEKLVVTSLTRPSSRQPNNASSRSVHPTGMAVDVRRSNSRACRSWLESVLLSLEKAGVLEGTRESYPPHYHIALYPDPYSEYVTQLAAREVEDLRGSESLTDYRVRRGDSLWDIARDHGVSVDQLKAENGLRNTTIYAGQLLRVPVVR